jgi:hypothetical protein
MSVGGCITLYCFSKFEASIPKASCVIEIIVNSLCIIFEMNPKNGQKGERREDKQFASKIPQKKPKRLG